MSTSDRELLELAAKASGIDVNLHPNRSVSRDLHFIHKGNNWNPLTDDGDALRLAVKLDLLHPIGAGLSKFRASWDSLYDDGCLPDDDLEATRLAIVRAAAEIGRSMP